MPSSVLQTLLNSFPLTENPPAIMAFGLLFRDANESEAKSPTGKLAGISPIISSL